MKVAHVVPAFFPSRPYGGAVESTYQLCRHLASIGCTVRVLTTDADGPGARCRVRRDREVDLSERLAVRYCARVAWDSASPALVLRTWEYARWADVIHLTAVYSCPTIPVLLAARLLDKPVVWSSRGAFQQWAGSRRLALKRPWDLACRAVRPGRLVLHVTSDDERRQTLKRWPHSETVVIPNGVDVPPDVPRHPRAGDLRLLYVGRIHPIKGLENLVDACAILRERGEVDWSLRIAGDGEPEYVESLRRRIAERSLGGRIQMVGWTNGAEKQGLFGSSDLLVCPSHSESFGNVVTEALAHAVPVIASRATPWAALEKLGCGLWVDNDPDSLADAIGQASGAPLLEWGAAGQCWMRQEYSWPTIADRMLKLYSTLLEKQ